MKKIIFFVLILLMCNSAYAVKEFAMRFPAGTPVEVYNPTNPPPGAGGGDSITVNGVAVDTQANLDDSIYITWTLIDGGAGGPDDIQGTIITTSFISDTAYANTWNGANVTAPSKNVVYDILHQYDTDDDGDIDNLDATILAAYLKLDQSAPQTITASPICNWGTARRIPYYTAGKQLTDNAGLNFNDTFGHMGVGRAAEAEYLLDLYEAATFQLGVQAGAYIKYVHAPAGALGGACNAIGSYVQTQWSSDLDGSTNAYIYGTKSEAIGTAAYTGAVNTLEGVYGIGRNQLSAAATTVIGVHGTVINDDIASENGNITNAYSLLASGYTDKGTGIMVNRYGLYIENVTGGGLLTNQYGVYCPALTAGGTLNYFLYNISAPSDFGSGSITTTGTVDFGGASLEVPNTAGNVAVTATANVAIDTTNKQFAWSDGTNEYAIPGTKIAQGTFDMAAQYDIDSDLWLFDLHADSYPNGIYITKIYVDCTVADPTTELNANLMYCDAVADGAFPGANATLIKAIDTTTGNFADAAVNTAVATGKTVYIDIDVDPADATTQYHIRIHYRIEED